MCHMAQSDCSIGSGLFFIYVYIRVLWHAVRHCQHGFDMSHDQFLTFRKHKVQLLTCKSFIYYGSRVPCKFLQVIHETCFVVLLGNL